MGYYKDRQKTQDLQNKMIKAPSVGEFPLLSGMIFCHIPLLFRYQFRHLL